MTQENLEIGNKLTAELARLQDHLGKCLNIQEGLENEKPFNVRIMSTTNTNWFVLLERDITPFGGIEVILSTYITDLMHKIDMLENRFDSL